MHPPIDGSPMPSEAFIESQIDALVREDDIDLALTLQLFALYHSIARRFLRRAMSHGSCAHSNPLRGQGQVIALLKQRDGLSTREMAELMDIRTASLNELLVKLEAKGLIKRCKSDTDGRVTIARLTEAGRAVEQTPFLNEMSGYYTELTEEEKRALITLLSRIEEAAESGASNADEGDIAGAEDMFNRPPWSKLRTYIQAYGMTGEGSIS